MEDKSSEKGIAFGITKAKMQQKVVVTVLVKLSVNTIFPPLG